MTDGISNTNGGSGNMYGGAYHPPVTQPPPGGQAGLAGQTVATQVNTIDALTRMSMGRARRAAPRKRRRAAPRRRVRDAVRRTKSRGKKRAHLVKGSRAAKTYMAKLRRMARRKRR